MMYAESLGAGHQNHDSFVPLRTAVARRDEDDNLSD
jgi:hypothetical protein